MRASPLQISRMLAWMLLPLAAMPAHAAGVVISQVYGGNGSTFARDYVELFNAGSSPVDISGWSVQYASATGTGHFSGNGATALAGILQPGQYYLVGLASSAAGAALPAVDASGTSNLSGTNGKVVLVNVASGLSCNGGSAPCSAAQQAQIVDLVGYGSANYYESAAAPALTSTSALLRAAGGCTDSNSNAADFTAGTPAPRNSATPLNPCGGGVVNAPVVAVCGSLTVDAGVGGSLALSASDADSLVDQAAIVSAPMAGIALSAITPATVDGESAHVSLLVDASVPAGSYPVQVRFANNEAQSATCSASVTVQASALTPVHQIQGSGAASPLNGMTVTTSGVVTAVFPNLKGYYLQDPSGDGDTATSDGIFVYVGGTSAVNVGDGIRLQATVTEYFGVTELTAPANVVLMSTGNTVTPVPVSLPEPVNGDLERYEGMLVEIVTPMTVAQNYFQGRYGQVTLSAGGRLFKPTNVHRPNSAAALDMAQDNARRVLILDDGSSLQNPNPIPYIGADATLRAGDTVTQLVGVIDYGLITSSNPGPMDYKLHPVRPPVFSRDNPRTSAPEAVGGNIRVASANLLNYFTTISSGGACYPGNTAADCRGASTAAELQRQRDKMLAALAAVNADVFGFMELENNGDTAVQDVATRLNALLGAGTYAVVPKPAAAGSTGTDAIRVGMIYKPGKLALAGPALSDTDAINNRPPLAQTFVAANGEKFSVVVNHLKSKGCSSAAGADLDQGDGQGCYNDRRQQQADRLLQHFIPLIKSTAGDDDVLVIGDLNAYGMEDPVVMLTDGGLVNEAEKHLPGHYSYIFDGESGALDHVLATPALDTQVAGITEWHINADEPSVIDYNTEFKPQDLYSATPYRASDHDPVLVGLDLVKKLNGSAGRDILVGTAGDDVLTGGAGADTLTGGGGRDRFVYASLLDGVDTLTDFQSGNDLLVLAPLLQSLGIASANPLADGVVTCAASGANAVIGIDADGIAGPARSRALAVVRNMGCAGLAQPANFDF